MRVINSVRCTYDGAAKRFREKAGNVIRFSVRVHPGSKAPTVGGCYDGALVVRVRARAADGAATAETCAALAEAFGVRPSAVRCEQGARSRTKVVAVEGRDDVLASRLDVLRSAT